MQRTLVCYRTAETGQPWPADIAERFSQHLTKHGVIHFEEGSDLERDFQEAIAKRRLGVRRRTLIDCAGQDLYVHPFHYLSVDVDNEYARPPFMETDTMCRGDGQTLCRMGAWQKEKLQLDREESKECDIMTAPGWLKPKIYIVSRRLKKLLDSVSVSGCHFVPCLNLKRNYPGRERWLSFESQSLADDATHFQLLITEKMRRPPYAGRLLRVIQRCGGCGTVYLADMSSTPTFEADDLPEADFQVYDSYRFDDGEVVTIAGEIAIVSVRVLRVFLEQDVIGLVPYLTDPPVRHGVVQFR